MNGNAILDVHSPSFDLDAYIRSVRDDYTTWEGQVTSAKQALYALLAKSYSLACAYRSTAAIRDEVDSRLPQSMRDLESSPHHKVLYLTTVCQEKQRSAYAKVLQAADNEGVLCSELPEWISKKGGIEKIRLHGRSRKRDALARAAAIHSRGSAAFLARQPISTVSIDDLDVDPPEGELLLLVCKVENGTAIPVAIIDDESTMNAALSWAAASLIDDVSRPIETAGGLRDDCGESLPTTGLGIGTAATDEDSAAGESVNETPLDQPWPVSTTAPWSH